MTGPAACIECGLLPYFDDDSLLPDGYCVECRLDAEALAVTR
jgi:hypothetical protein